MVNTPQKRKEKKENMPTRRADVDREPVLVFGGNPVDSSLSNEILRGERGLASPITEDGSGSRPCKLSERFLRKPFTPRTAVERVGRTSGTDLTGPEGKLCQERRFGEDEVSRFEFACHK